MSNPVSSVRVLYVCTQCNKEFREIKFHKTGVEPKLSSWISCPDCKRITARLVKDAD